MPRFAAVFTALLFATAGTAHADRYVSLGIGKSDLGGGLNQSFDDTDSGAYKLSVGQRFGNWALEASLFGSDFIDGLEQESTLSLGVGLKYHFMHTGPLSLYGMGGLNKTWLNDHAGTGYDLGLGAELGFKMPFAQMAIFAELAHHETELRSTGTADLDGSIRTAMIGVSVGF